MPNLQGSVDIIEVGPTQPTDPNVELWYDTSAPGSNVVMEYNSYTPTLTGMVVGAGGTNSAEYVYTGTAGVGGRGVLVIRGQIIFGTSGQTFPTTPTFSLPAGFNISATNSERIIGDVNLNDVSATNQAGVLWPSGNAAVRPLCLQISGAQIYYDTIITTRPFTWAASDRMIWTVNIDAIRV